MKMKFMVIWNVASCAMWLTVMGILAVALLLGHGGWTVMAIQLGAFGGAAGMLNVVMTTLTNNLKELTGDGDEV